jgi:hypothetical protein
MGITLGVGFRLWHLPLRLTAGAFILNSGLGKLRTDDDEVFKRVHGLASGTYPQLQSWEPRTFVRALGAGETALGVALLAPVVPPVVAGAGLSAFAAGLLGLYFKTPGMTVDGIRPSPQGLALAKDSWLLGMGLALLVDRPRRDRSRRARSRRAAPAPSPES